MQQIVHTVHPYNTSSPQQQSDLFCLSLWRFNSNFSMVYFLLGYRHHMYSVLQFMWKEEKYRESLTKMGDEVRANETQTKIIQGHISC